MYYLLQLLFAVIAVYVALNFSGDVRLFIPLGCLMSMFIVGRFDRARYEKKEARKTFLKTEIERIARKDPDQVKERDFFTVNSLLWPKGELVLIDAVQSVLKDMGLRVAAGGKYKWVDRIAGIPNSDMIFGVEILMNDREIKKDHPKIERALQFEKEKKGNEKTVIIASMHIHEPLSERERLNKISIELHDFLSGFQITLMTAYTLYQLWQRSKAGEIEIPKVLLDLFSHPGGIFLPPESQEASTQA